MTRLLLITLMLCLCVQPVAADGPDRHKAAPAVADEVLGIAAHYRKLFGVEGER